MLAGSGQPGAAGEGGEDAAEPFRAPSSSGGNSMRPVALLHGSCGSHFSRGGSVCLTSPSSESQSPRLAPRCSLSLLLELGGRGGGQCISPSQETPRPPLESGRLRWGGVGAEKMRQHICCSGCYCSEVALLGLPLLPPALEAAVTPGSLPRWCSWGRFLLLFYYLI